MNPDTSGPEVRTLATKEQKGWHLAIAAVALVGGRGDDPACGKNEYPKHRRRSHRLTKLSSRARRFAKAAPDAVAQGRRPRTPGHRQIAEYKQHVVDQEAKLHRVPS
jgi:hypothetical protein